MELESKISIIVAGVALLFSIISPIISAWIQGHYQMKVKKIEADLEITKRGQQFYDEHRARVIENYIKATGALIVLLSDENETNYNSAMGEIYLYIGKDLWPIIDDIHTNITNDNEATLASFIKLCKALSAEEVRKKYEVEPYSANERAPHNIEPKAKRV